MSEITTALPDWAHATLQSDGSIYFSGWESIRAAIDAAYAALGRERSGDVPTWEWNLVGLATAFHRHASIPTCSECEKPVTGIVIRCADCKTALHEGHCAEHHFWPNGRDTRNCLTIMEIRQRDEITKLKSRLEEFKEAAERICFFDWSDNDPDGVRAIGALRILIHGSAK